MTKLLLALDPGFVVVFVAVGRDAHDEAGGTVVGTAAPFLIALAAGWVAARAWRDPFGIRTGIVAAAVTICGGMLLRSFAFGEGTAPAFVTVAALFLSVTLIGWRAAASAAGLRRDEGRARPSPDRGE